MEVVIMVQTSGYFNKVGNVWIRFPHESAGCGAIIADVSTGTLRTIPTPAGTAEAFITGITLAAKKEGGK
jgi:hypothetical protein